MKKTKIKYKGKLKSYMQWPVVFLVIMAIMNVVVYTISIRAGFVVSGFLALFVVLSLLLIFRHRPLILNDLISFATQYGQVQKTLLDEFSIPYALLDSDGRLIWMNEEFSLTVGKDKDYRKNIQTLFPEIHSGTMPGLKGVKEIEIHYEDRDFCARLQRVSVQSLEEAVNIIEIPQDRNYVIALYLFDNTELNHYIQENQDQKMVPGLIYLDNYDEALDSVEEVRRSLLVALIDRKITKYISNYDGIVKKFETDKYFIVIKNKYLKELQANRFSLLEEVKAVNIGNEMSVTLSIGIGINGGSYQQDYEFSRIAIELALGRGGDQAVVKENDKISYYGGKSQQMEKNTRVKARVKAQALREFIENSEEVVVMGHKITDIDSLGSAVGIYRAAKMLDKKAHIVLGDINSSIRPWVNMFRNSRDFDEDMFITHEQAEAIVNPQTVLVVVDTNRPSLCECESLLNMTKVIVILDHHRRSSDVIENAVLSYIEPFASSACEMVAEILQYFTDDVRLKTVEADCIYAGIIVDTNNFVAKTGVRTFEAAAFLRRSGADVTRVRKLFRDDITSYRARAEAVRRAEIFMHEYAISRCPSENLESPTVVGAQAANELLNIVGIKASFVLTEFQGKIYFSARAIDEVNVQIIMERLGGGGHQNIAGAQLSDVTMSEAINKLKEVLTKMTEEGAI